MSGVNSKCSRGGLIPPSAKRLKQEDSTSTLARIGLTEPQTPVDRVLRIPEELLADIFGYLAADSDPEELMNLRLVCPLWKRQAFFALKTNLALLPWIVVNDNSEDWLQFVKATLKTELGNCDTLLSLESCIRNLIPGNGLPLKLIVSKWTPELESFLRDYASEIVSIWICGKSGESFDGFPSDLGGIELPALEHAPFTAIDLSSDNEECENFVKALAFWKELVKDFKNLKACPVDIRMSLTAWTSGLEPLTSDDEVFHLLEWNQVNSLICSNEFFAQASASKDLSALQKLKCGFTMDWGGEYVSQLSLERVSNLQKMTFDYPIEWILNHPMKNLRVLKLDGTTITSEQSPSELLPNLKEVVVLDEEDGEDGDLLANGPLSGLISRGGVYENVVNLTLTDSWTDLNERIGDLAIQIFDSFPGLTNLQWTSEPTKFLERGLVDNKNALKAAPVMFSKLECLTSLVLSVSLVWDRELVELITGVTHEEIPWDKDSWPTKLEGNPRSICNLKHLQSFGLHVKGSGWKTIVPKRNTSFLFTAAFRTMGTLKELYFKNIIFQDTSCVTEWQQMGRKIQVVLDDQFALVSSSGDDGATTDSESSGDGDE